jgi:hypothetical protein
MLQVPVTGIARLTHWRGKRAVGGVGVGVLL